MRAIFTLAAIVMLTACDGQTYKVVPQVEKDNGDSRISAPASVEKDPMRPNPDGGWTTGEDGEPSFIGQPAPNPPTETSAEGS